MRTRVAMLRTAIIFIAVLALPFVLTACGKKHGHGSSWG